MVDRGRTVVRGGIVLPCEGRRVVHDPGSVIFEGNEILAVGTVEEIDRLADGVEVVDATDHAVIPGLHNCHMHSGLLRGTAESMALWEWLETYVDPAHRALTAEIAESASYLCYTESLRARPVIKSVKGLPPQSPFTPSTKACP